MKNFINKLISCFLLPLLVISCNINSQSSLIKSENTIKTIKADVIRENYRQYLKNSLKLSDSVLTDELRKIKYDITFTKVTYEATDPFGKTKILSGLIGYPVLPAGDKDKQLSIVSIQHGTLFDESDAPSLNKFKDATTVKDALSLIPATHENGYIVVVPDYFGYGANEKDMHYYEVRSSLAEAARKLIEAVPSFAQDKSLHINLTKLFLFGYSEGGFATMSTLKSFSENPGNFTDITTVAGAGAYDKVETATHVIQQTSGDSPYFTASYLWVLLTYNKVYNINRNLNQLVQPEIESVVKKYTETDKIMQEQQIPSVPSKAFNPIFVKGISEKTDEAFIKALIDNDVSNFEAKGTVVLVHGTKDTWVPTFNTELAYDRLQKRGVNVSTHYFEGGTHSTTYPIFVLKALKNL
ncbi:alpha/beta hydrolase family protein [Dysgonomonas gadei]|uniref:Peptidase S9 prolyl oligopeptidase catalytic domain-containing protein n=1 Tax=Dysgonomonas gadei ATCC BAA-286 TaxID=742766 RepID=F5J2F6_9BACT|nr:prolyl oligopeptidase family serine peptidase [Dysgonomonas gadei]EGK00116.1 hypothetical protein HMPREF9455_03523 [Dysgonomonas gadei ATCC BAA-286]